VRVHGDRVREPIVVVERRKIMRRLLPFILCLSIFALSCGDSDSDTSSSSTTASTTTTTSSSTTSPTTTSAAPATTPPTTTTGSPVSNDQLDACVGDDWQLVDAGPFTFHTPGDLLDQNPQGIDSLVGRFVSAEMEVVFDFGWYSPNLDEMERLGATLVPVLLDDLDGAYATAEAGAAAFSTQLYVSIPDESGNALWMGVNYDDSARTADAECVVRTVRFS
jgi:ABC-type Fe3+-hydroxamate transport system substrate-binding protein